jgi:hypothetical protein
MKKKILALFFCLNLTCLINCFEHCKDYEFFDYEGIKAVVQNPYVMENDSLSFGTSYINIEYLSDVKFNFNFGNKLYATVDCDKGYGGEKYPLNRITITSDSDFNTDFPANSELNEIISVNGTNSNGDYVIGKVIDFEASNVNLSNMYLSMRPNNNESHKITIEIEKSNGEVLSSTTEEIIWE